MKRVGYFMSDLKNKKMEFASRFAECARGHGFEIIKIDLNLSLDEQGPFDLIIHKLTDIHVHANIGDKHSQILFTKFQEYTSNHPEIFVLNPVSSVRNIIDRTLQYGLLAASRIATDPDSKLFVPSFVEIRGNDIEENRVRLKEADVRYPMICKPVIAQGTASCHEMSLIFCDEGLKDINPPCVVQSFINHGAALFKGFVVGKYISIVRRPSLKNLKAGNFPTIPFNSHHISKPDSHHFLTVDADGNAFTDPKATKLPETSYLMKVVRSLRDTIGMDLFGVDLIMDEVSGRYGVIDVNVFPGYEGVPLFMDKLVEHIDDLLSQDQTADSTTTNHTSPRTECVSKKPRLVSPNKLQQQQQQYQPVENGMNHVTSSVDIDGHMTCHGEIDGHVTSHEDIADHVTSEGTNGVTGTEVRCKTTVDYMSGKAAAVKASHNLDFLRDQPRTLRHDMVDVLQ